MRIMFVLLLSLTIAPLAFANCGSPPDPWGDASGYASWCSCMGGSYNYQTTECSGVSSSSSSSSSSYSSSSSGDWYCLAKSTNGACGYGFDYATQSEAKYRALTECRKHSNGGICNIKFCNTNFPGGNPCGGRNSGYTSSGSSHQSSTYQSNTTTQSSKRSKQYDTSAPKGKVSCNQCVTLLKNSIRSRLGSSNRTFLPTWVDQAIAGFYNCQQRTKTGDCEEGEIFIRSIKRACRGFLGFNTPAYEDCITRIVD